MTDLTIIDGHSYIYGAFYGVPDAASARGTGVRLDAVYGFFALLRVIINEYPKNKLFIVFDSKKWFQKTMDSKLPDDMKDTKSIMEQQTIIQKVLDKLNIKWAQHPTIKADNIIASLATYWAVNNGHVQISSADFDFVQLISTKISLARNRHGLITKYDAGFVKEKFGVTPNQYIDFQSLIGDPNDGFIGIKGIGPKTAAKLLNEYGNIATVYKSLDDLPKILSEKLRANKNLVLKNQKNIPMTRDIPIKDFLKEPIPDIDISAATGNINTILDSIGIK